MANLPETARAPGIDLSLLPPPDVVEQLDYESILAANKATLLSLIPADQRADVAATLALETEPLTILLQAASYREMLLRSRINQAARQCYLASASGTNLDHLAAYYSVKRHVTDPGNPNAIPSIPPAYEADNHLRTRTQLAVEGMSTAGPTEGYRYHALSAHGGVEDANATSPVPGQVLISILGWDDGVPGQAVLDAVGERLSARDIRPLTDEVIVQAVEIVPFIIDATITLYPGPSPEPVISAARAALNATLASLRRIGYDIPRSALFAALHQPGVQNVEIHAPADDLDISETQCGRCDGIALELAGVPHV
ncbi:MAG: baseplate J/gp47 family protein [Betaproteobacteria bacterium]|nr:baseplate J/gp47 family protein [Betaproteobacteria bacterium]